MVTTFSVEQLSPNPSGERGDAGKNKEIQHATTNTGDHIILQMFHPNILGRYQSVRFPVDLR
jgi:hypothetical protein